jgi:thioredoxin reductase (NADPH)
MFNIFNSICLISFFFFFSLSDNGKAIQDKLVEISGQKTVPNVYIQGKQVGGSGDIHKLYEEKKLMALIIPPSATNYEYDLIVIGGGSGGLSCAKVQCIFKLPPV